MNEAEVKKEVLQLRDETIDLLEEDKLWNESIGSFIDQEETAPARLKMVVGWYKQKIKELLKNHLEAVDIAFSFIKKKGDNITLEELFVFKGNLQTIGQIVSHVDEFKEKIEEFRAQK